MDTKQRAAWAFSSALAAILVASTAQAQVRCYVPTDQTAGWKQVLIPDEAPGLAAEGSIEQFRSDEPVMIWMSGVDGSVTLSSHRPGKIEYLFRLDSADWSILEATFSRWLTGEKVDIIAHTPQGQVPLWLERRHSGNDLHVEWSMPGVYAVTVRIHHHLREHSTVASWRAGARASVARSSWSPPGFRAGRTLYYLHPGGQIVQLCDLPRQYLTVNRSSLVGAVPAPVRLRLR